MNKIFLAFLNELSTKKRIPAEPLRPRDPKPDFDGYASRRGKNSTINTRDTRTYFSCWNGAQFFFFLIPYPISVYVTTTSVAGSTILLLLFFFFFCRTHCNNF